MVHVVVPRGPVGAAQRSRLFGARYWISLILSFIAGGIIAAFTLGRFQFNRTEGECPRCVAEPPPLVNLPWPPNDIPMVVPH